jgi:hypothetical protein
MNGKQLSQTLPPLEKRLFFGQCPHCQRPAVVWDRVLNSLQCEGCGAVWDGHTNKPAAPVCPVCGKALKLHVWDDQCRVEYRCHACCYSQPDAAQRPKRPEPREGYHASHWDYPQSRLGSFYFDAEGYVCEVLNPWREEDGKRWIAVEDDAKPDVDGDDVDHQTRMIVCPRCGNKRCPHASDHRNACTNSNEPGQPGSVYGPNNSITGG